MKDFQILQRSLGNLRYPGKIFWEISRMLTCQFLPSSKSGDLQKPTDTIHLSSVLPCVYDTDGMDATNAWYRPYVPLTCGNLSKLTFINYLLLVNIIGIYNVTSLIFTLDFSGSSCCYCTQFCYFLCFVLSFITFVWQWNWYFIISIYITMFKVKF